MSINTQAVIEGVKELGRVLFFAGLTALAGWIASKIAGFDPTSLYYVIGTLVLRVLDKYVHTNDDIDRNGLAPF